MSTMNALSRGVGLLAALGLLTGCASSSSDRWAKPGATEEQVNRDSADCLASSQTVAPGGREGPRMVVNQDRYRQCMANRGYASGPSR